jgi:CRISPR/Cas system-associated endoribonuclease Cas2
MAIVLVTYDLKKPGQNYTPVHDYLKRFTHCKQMESVWLLDTTTDVQTIREGVRSVADGNDIVFVVKLQRDWSSWNYACADWLNNAARNW